MLRVFSKVPQLALQKYKKQQEPFICCDDKGQKNVAVVDSSFLKKWEMGKNVSNVAMVSPKTKKATRVKIENRDGKNIRIGKACGSVL